MTVSISKNVPTRKVTFYGIGGPIAEVWQIDDITTVPELWAESWAQGVPVIVIGKGSNTALADSGLSGRVFQVTDQHSQLTPSPDGQSLTVVAHAGAEFQRLIESTNHAGFGDWCSLSGIPGTVGGHLRGNAGAFGAETADRLQWVEYADRDGRRHTLKAANAHYAYRESIFKSHPDWVILRAGWLLTEVSDPTNALTRTKTLYKERWAKYPPGRSGGSVFKNPNGDFAGRLLESVGAKGFTHGGAQISDRHANFFINQKNATQADLLHLMTHFRAAVTDQHGITLQPEIQLYDPQGQKVVWE